MSSEEWMPQSRRAALDVLERWEKNGRSGTGVRDISFATQEDVAIVTVTLGLGPAYGNVAQVRLVKQSPSRGGAHRFWLDRLERIGGGDAAGLELMRVLVEDLQRLCEAWESAE